MLSVIALALGAEPTTTVQVKLGLDASTDDAASFKVAPSLLWVDHTLTADRYFTEHAVSVWGKVSTADGEAAWAASDPAPDFTAGLSWTMSGRRMPTQADVMANATSALLLRDLMLDRCRKACAQKPVPDSDAAWCADDKKISAMKEDTLDPGEYCPSGLVAYEQRQFSPQTSTLPALRAITFEAGFGVETHEWIEEADGVATAEERATVPFSAAIRAITSTPTPERTLLLGFNVEFAQGVEESETVADVCQSKGTLVDDDGESFTVDACEEKVFGAPEPTRELGARVGLGYMPQGYANYRLTAYPLLTLDLAPGAESVVKEVGFEVLAHVHLGRMSEETYAGAYKGILAFGPTVIWDPSNEDPGRPAIGIRLAILGQKHLLDPTVGI